MVSTEGFLPKETWDPPKNKKWTNQMRRYIYWSDLCMIQDAPGSNLCPSKVYHRCVKLSRWITAGLAVALNSRIGPWIFVDFWTSNIRSGFIQKKAHWKVEDHGSEDGKIHPTKNYPDPSGGIWNPNQRRQGLSSEDTTVAGLLFVPFPSPEGFPRPKQREVYQNGRLGYHPHQILEAPNSIGFHDSFKTTITRWWCQIIFFEPLLYLGKRSNLTNLFKWVETTNQISCCCLILQAAIGLKTRHVVVVVVVVKLPSYTKLFFSFSRETNRRVKPSIGQRTSSFFKIWTVPFFVWSQTCFILLVVETLITFPIGS